MGKITFITGGARSGKSSLALSLASGNSSGQEAKRVFIATLGPLDEDLDEEMKGRVEQHRRERGAEWETIEEPLDIARLIAGLDGKYDAVVLDCLTLWLSNVMLSGREPLGEMDAFIAAIKKTEGALFIVSNEVGMGIVPENAVAREFRDLAGRLNQAVAEAATEVYLTVSGIPVRIKGG